MKIGELAQQTGVSIDAIRYYERVGLIPQAHRSTNNYRVYTTEHAEQLVFIRRARELDMSLDEIRLLLHWRCQPGAECDAVNALVDEHIGHVSRRIRELRALENQLKTLRAQCRQVGTTADCGILTGLIQTDASGVAVNSPHQHVARVHGQP